ncbi:MAG: response regulator [Zoogloea sp.]|nr:response regulator [Zoogloea sp.]
MTPPAATPRPLLARSLLLSLSATFIVCLLAFGCAVHFLIVVPATQALARVQLDLTTAQIRAEAERDLQRIETQLRTARAWGESGRLRFDDAAGFNVLMVPLLAGDDKITAVHLMDAEGRELSLQRAPEGWRNRVFASLPRERGGRSLHWNGGLALLDERPLDNADDMSQRPWFRTPDAPRSWSGLGWTAPHRPPTSGEGTLTVSTRWTLPDGRKRILAFDILLVDLSRLTVDTPVGERGGSAILTDAGDVVGVPRYPRFANRNELREAVLQPVAALDVDFLTRGYARWTDIGRKDATPLTYINEGETWLAQFVPLQVGNQRWWVAGFAREADFIPARLQDVGPVLALMILLSGAVAIFLVRRIARRIQDALATLVTRSERIGRLDLSPPPPFSPPWQEFAELADTQERMRHHLREAGDALLRSQAELQDKVAERTRQLDEKGQALSDQLLFIEVLIDALPNPVFYKDPEARFLGCNTAYEQAFGTTRGFLRGKTVLDLPYLPSADRIAYHDEDRRLIASAGTSHKEIPLPYADGQVHDTLYWVRGFRLANGAPGGLLGAIVDISDQKRAERSARAAEERSRQMLESSPIAVVINRIDGSPLFANTRALVLAGIDMDGFMKRPVTAWFRDPAAAEQALARLKSGQPVRDMEVEFQNAAGQPFWTLMTMEQIEVGGQPALISWSYDITARKLAERELRKLSLAVEQSPSMLVITTPGGAIQYANPRYCQVSGYSARDLNGILPELVDQDGRPLEFLAEQWQALRQDGVWRRECQLRKASGERLWVGISVSGLVEDNGEITHCVWVIEDLALYRQAVETLREAKRLAEEAAESKARFLANMSHEIRTPMNAIIGLASLALDTGLQPQQRDYLTKIHGAGTSLLGVINDVLDFSKIEAGKLRLERTAFTLDQVLDNVLTYVAQRAQEKGLELILQVAPDVPQDLLGDPLRLAQVLTNLLGNAVKFTEKGEVQLQVRLVRGNAQNADLRFEVIDTGIGIDGEQISRLFEAFSQADSSMTRRFGGTGLGLSISRHLVELMGGRLEVRSVPGEGSCFSFEAGFEVAQHSAPRAMPGLLEGLRVLVVDDHPVAREVLLRQLRNFPFRSETVGSAAEALAAIRRADSGDRFGLVLMDLRMPGQDGIEATRRIKQDRSLSAPPSVILLTAYGDERVAGEAADAGADGFLHKPATASTLLDAIVSTFGLDAAPQPHTLQAGDALAGVKILVVEDNDINQQIARGLLERLGAQVSVAGNGRIALQVLQSAAEGAFDVVLMDLQMPEMDGFEATQRIRSDVRLTHLPIIAMTAHAMAEERKRCLDAGMDDHVAKPIVIERLVDAILRQVRPARPRPTTTAQATPAPTARPGLPELPGLKVDAALRRVGDDPALYLGMLRHFVATQGDCAQRIGEALEHGLTEDAERLAHTVRGSAANLGASAIQDAAGELEEELRRGADTRRALSVLAIELAALRTLLKKSSPAEASPSGETPEVDEAALDAAITTLTQLLESADGNAPSHFRQIRNALARRIGAESTNEMAEALQHYDYDRALACLRKP